jgi:hypothetical protein
VTPLKKSYENSLVIRRALEKLDNSKLDLFVIALETGIASKIFSGDTGLDMFKIASKILKPFFNEK